jgi:hypothetical protein
MAEEEAKKEKEKLEFTPEGEALGYISLDQARVLAMEHARDNREFYGPHYANRELVWEELSAEESEDYYRIRLSYRPHVACVAIRVSNNSPSTRPGRYASAR